MAVLRTAAVESEVLLSFSQNGITWRVLLRPDLQRSGCQAVVGFHKTGKRGNNLLDMLIGWSAGSWRSTPSSRIPKYLLERIDAELTRRFLAPAPGQAKAERPQQEAPQGKPQTAEPKRQLRFPCFLSVQLLEAHCPGYLQRHSCP